MSTTRCEHPRFALVLLAFLAVAPLPSAARAQEGNRQAAKPLFEEARRLMQAGRYAEACAKLEETRKLYAGPGVLLNLGDCYEHLGRTASAWTAFGESAAVASRAGRADEESEANRRRNLVTPRLSRIAVHVTKEVPGLVIARDAVPLARSDWGQAIPVDPGVHEIRAEASGYFRWQTRTTVTGPGQTATVEVPELQLQSTPESAAASQGVPGPAPATPPPAVDSNPVPTPPADSSKQRIASYEAPASTGHGQRTIGLVLGGAGLAAFSTGVVVGVVAKSEYDSAEREGVGRHADSVAAVNTGNAGTVLAICGGVMAATGAVLWFTAPRRSTTVGVDGRQVWVQGHF